MKWTKQRKIGAALVTLAGLAFGADQLFFGGPQGTDSAGQPGAAAAGPTADKVRTTAASLSSSANAGVRQVAFLARRLEEVAGEKAGAPVKDAFKPPVEWFPKPKTPEVAELPAKAEPTVDFGAQFKARHKLIGVMRSGPAGSGQGLAVISTPGGTVTVRVGQAVDGVVLQRVDDGQVRLNDAGHEFVLELPRPGFSSNAAAQ